MKKKAQYVHGEVNFFECEIPEGAREYTPKAEELTAKGLIVGESETTGNHHCIETQNVSFYEKDGTLYMTVHEDSKVSCLHDNRHDTMTLPKGTYKRKIAQEYDYFTKAKRNVAD